MQPINKLRQTFTFPTMLAYTRFTLHFGNLIIYSHSYHAHNAKFALQVFLFVFIYALLFSFLLTA